MRIDHLAYQQAVRVAGLGLLLQIVLALGLVIGGRLAGDTALVFAAMYVGATIPIWIGLTLLFHQHRLERLEALELDELAAARGAAADQSLFERTGSRVAARRLAVMHTWLMPAISLLVCGLLALVGWWILDYFRKVDDPNRDITPFSAGEGLGYQLAISIALALAAFIVSRFVAGMARQPVWANLRGGAGAMVGNALILLAVAIGIVFHFFQKPVVLEWIAYGIAIFAFAVAAEILLNFVLNLYRPRRPGETPRPAFDSRVLSLFAAPDSIVRSINEAVNYQFGFDVTSSWGYRLLLRSFTRLALFALAVLLLLSAIVVVEPGRQGLRLRFGRPVGEVYEREVMFKLPWPVETAEVLDVGRLSTLTLGNPPAPSGRFAAWGDEGILDPQRNVFLVAASRQRAELSQAMQVAAARASMAAEDAATSGITAQFAIVDADILLAWRVRDGKLLEWLEFAGDARIRRSNLTTRERILRSVALREATQFLSTQPLDELLSPTGDSLETSLRDRIQGAFDRMRTGIEVISVTVPRLRPPGGPEAGRFVEPSIAVQNARKLREQATSEVSLAMALLIGGEARAREVADLVAELERTVAAKGSDSAEALEMRLRIERLITETQAQAAARIATARAERWSKQLVARRRAADVLGQAASWEIDPDLYRQRKLMEALAAALPTVRVKYVLGLTPDRVRVNAEMQEPDAGLNIYDYLQKPEE